MKKKVFEKTVSAISEVEAKLKEIEEILNSVTCKENATELTELYNSVNDAWHASRKSVDACNWSHSTRNWTGADHASWDLVSQNID